MANRRWSASGILSCTASAFADHNPVGTLALGREIGLWSATLPVTERRVGCRRRADRAGHCGGGHGPRPARRRRGARLPTGKTGALGRRVVEQKSTSARLLREWRRPDRPSCRGDRWWLLRTRRPRPSAADQQGRARKSWRSLTCWWSEAGSRVSWSQGSVRPRRCGPGWPNCLGSGAGPSGCSAPSPSHRKVCCPRCAGLSRRRCDRRRPGCLRTGRTRRQGGGVRPGGVRPGARPTDLDRDDAESARRVGHGALLRHEEEDPMKGSPGYRRHLAVPTFGFTGRSHLEGGDAARSTR